MANVTIYSFNPTGIMKRFALNTDKRSILILLVSLVFLLYSFTATAQSGKLGNIDFPNSGKPEAQDDFIMGILLLHSFEYNDARSYFRKAQQIDNNFAMAFWGEAMTRNHPIWFQQDKSKALKALNKIALTPSERPGKVKFPVEKELIKAANILYGDGDKNTRDLNYMTFLADLHQQFPEDHEIACFYALSLMGSSHNGRHIPTYLKAAEVAQKVLRKNPKHPGALHYTIHAYDEPEHAHMGLHAANQYAKVAPGSEHALHMPSHIFVALGYWDRVVASNEAAWEAGEERFKRKKLSHAQRAYHSLLWLNYGYLQQNRPTEAKRLVEIIEDDVKYHTTGRAKVHLNQMRAAYLVHTKLWNSEIADIRMSLDGVGLVNSTLNLFVNGLVALNRGDLQKCEKIINQINRRRLKSNPETLDGDIAMCYAPGTMPRKAREARTALIFEMELNALLQARRGNAKAAEAILKEAVSLEDNLSFNFGPPVIVKPSHEAYGELLLKEKRFEDAMIQFEKVLERAPRRILALQGYALAAERSNHSDKAKEVRKLLEEIVNPPN